MRATGLPIPTPIGPAGLRHDRQTGVGLRCGLQLTGSFGYFDRLQQSTPCRQAEHLTMHSHLVRGGERVVIPSETVVDQRLSPARENKAETLAPEGDLVPGAIDQLQRFVFCALPGRQRVASIAAPRGGAGDLCTATVSGVCTGRVYRPSSSPSRVGWI